MKIVKQSHKILTKGVEFELALDRIEEAGRLCYKSKKSETEEARNIFIEGMVKKGHHSVIEHFNISVRFVTNRGVTHELVRHRLASYSQESTRWCNYTAGRLGSELTYILPVWFYNIHDYEIATEGDTPIIRRYWNWKESLIIIEDDYFKDVKLGARPEEARGILPNDLKTEIDMTCNVREWRHVFKERLFNSHAHPQIRALMHPLFLEMMEKLPPIFASMLYGR